MSKDKVLDQGAFIMHTHCIANEVEGKNPCNSSDAMGIYVHDPLEGEDEEWYDASCFACNQGFTKNQVYSSSVASELGIEGGSVVEKKDFKRIEKKPPLTKEEVKDQISKYGYVSGDYRGIKDEYSQFYGHLTETREDGSVISRRYPETREGSLWPTGYKIRYHPKSFSKIGQTGQNSELSGQVKFRSGGKYLLIVGGEEDKVAAYQMLMEAQQNRGQGDYDGVAVVSGTTGESSLAKQVANNYEFCDTFDIIVVGLDNDDAGHEATEEVVKVLPQHKVQVATWSGKDPNKMLQDGKERQFIRDFYRAKPVVQSEIKSSSNALEEAKEFLNCEKIPLPPYLHRLQKNMRGGIRTTGAIINLIGDTSIGKSLFTDGMLYHWFWNSPIVPTIVSLERTTGELTADFLSMHLKQNLVFFESGQDAIDVLEDPNNAEAIEDMLVDEYGRSRYYVLDERSGTPESLIATAERAIKQFGSRLIIFDPLTDFLRSLGTEAQENFMMWQKQKKKDGIVFINVLHTRKPAPDKDGNIRKVTEYDALGSGTFVQSADANIVINRDKMAEEEIDRNTTEVDLPKMRGGITGKACELYYDHKTRQLYDKEDYFNNLDKGNMNDDIMSGF